MLFPQRFISLTVHHPSSPTSCPRINIFTKQAPTTCISKYLGASASPFFDPTQQKKYEDLPHACSYASQKVNATLNPSQARHISHHFTFIELIYLYQNHQSTQQVRKTFFLFGLSSYEKNN